MLSPLHEALRWWVLRTPVLHPLVLNQVGWTADELQPDDPHVVMPSHPQMAVDAVLRLRSRGRPVGVLLYEVQLRSNPVKPYAWIAYIGGATGSSGLPALLCVLTVRAGVAKWARNVLMDSPRQPFRYVVVGPDEWEQWSRAQDPVDPSLQLIAWMCGRALDALPGAFSIHLAQCASLDIDDRRRYFCLLRAAIRALPPSLAEVLMNQTKSVPGFFPFHPDEWAAYDRGEAAGLEQGLEQARREVRQSLMRQLSALAPDRAVALANETDLDVLIQALAAASAR